MFALRGFAVLAIGVLALTGCAPAVHEAGPTAPARATPTPSATPTRVPTRPALADLVVTPDGLGYLVPGEAVPTVAAATAIVTFDPTKCVSAGGTAVGSPGAGAWIPNYPDGDSSLGAFPAFDVGPVDDASTPISEVEIWSPELRTVKHVGVGSTVAQLTAAYGSALSVDSADNSDVYVLTGSRSKLLFEVAKPGSGMDAVHIGTVVWMRIVTLDESYLHIANTDAAGSCPA